MFLFTRVYEFIKHLSSFRSERIYVECVTRAESSFYHKTHVHAAMMHFNLSNLLESENDVFLIWEILLAGISIIYLQTSTTTIQLWGH